MSKPAVAFVVATLVASGAISVSAQTQSGSRPSSVQAAIQMRGLSTDQYVQRAAISDLFEVEASKLALQRTQSPDVKAFAQRMINEHTKSTDNLKGLLQSASIGVTPPAQLDREHQRMLQQLQNASAAKFDRLFMEMQVKGHQDALKVQLSYGRRGDNDQLRNFANNSSSMVRDHLTQARQILRGLGDRPGA